METLNEEDNNANILSDEAPNRSDELPQNDAEEKYVPSYTRLEELAEKPEEATSGGVKMKVNMPRRLPIFQQHLRAEPKPLSFKECVQATIFSVFNISAHSLGGSLSAIACTTGYRAKILALQFDSKSGIQSPLSMGEAFMQIFSQFREMAIILLCYLLMLWLVLPLNPVLQFIFVLGMIGAPFYYVPELMQMASGIDVTWRFFNIPIIWFSALMTLLFVPIFVFLILLTIYLFQRYIYAVGPRVTQFNYIHPREPPVKEVKISLDALLGGDKASTS